MRRRKLLLLLPLGVIIIVGYLAARSFLLRPASSNANYQFVEVVAGLSRPNYVTNAGDERLFVVEQGGTIRIIENGELLETPFLDVSALINTDGLERGLLGMAFHPDYAENGWFYLNYTSLNTDDTVVRYTVSTDDPNVADPDSAAEILRVEDPYPNHNAGQLAFGPNGYLYVGMGDGGSGGDPHGNGQNRQVLLGKMLRLDVNGDLPYAIPPDNPFIGDTDIAPEIWAFGLRNPWRYSFDRTTGDLYIADVGQNLWEEIDFQPADSSGGENYGWSILEATHPFSQQPVPNDVVMPIAEYDHAQGCSVTGGYVYRGAAIPTLQGVYFFGDWCTGLLWTTRRDDAGSWKTEVLMNTGRQISSFGEDMNGELYLVDYNGSVLRLDTASE